MPSLVRVPVLMAREPVFCCPPVAVSLTRMVPSRMLAHLPRHAGYEWRVVGSDLVLVAIASGVVADVLLNVFQ